MNLDGRSAREVLAARARARGASAKEMTRGLGGPRVRERLAREGSRRGVLRAGLQGKRRRPATVPRREKIFREMISKTLNADQTVSRRSQLNSRPKQGVQAQRDRQAYAQHRQSHRLQRPARRPRAALPKAVSRSASPRTPLACLRATKVNSERTDRFHVKGCRAAMFRSWIACARGPRAAAKLSGNGLGDHLLEHGLELAVRCARAMETRARPPVSSRLACPSLGGFGGLPRLVMLPFAMYANALHTTARLGQSPRLGPDPATADAAVEEPTWSQHSEASCRAPCP